MGTLARPLFHATDGQAPQTDGQKCPSYESRWNSLHATARRTSDVLLPPKPNEFETTTETGWLIA